MPQHCCHRVWYCCWQHLKWRLENSGLEETYGRLRIRCWCQIGVLGESEGVEVGEGGEGEVGEGGEGVVGEGEGGEGVIVEGGSVKERAVGGEVVKVSGDGGGQEAAMIGGGELEGEGEVGAGGKASVGPVGSLSETRADEDWGGGEGVILGEAVGVGVASEVEMSSSEWVS